MSFNIIPASFITFLVLTNVCQRVNSTENGGLISKITRHLRPTSTWTDSEVVLEANRLMKQGSFGRAIPFYNLAISRESHDELLCLYYALRGKCQLMIGTCEALSKALQDYQTAFQKASKSSEGGKPVLKAEDWIELGDELGKCRIKYSTEFAKKAEWCYDLAIKMDSSKAEYFLKRGCCHLKGTGNLVQSILDMQQAIKLDSQDERSHEFLKDALLATYKFNNPEKEAMTLLNDQTLLTLCTEFTSRGRRPEAHYCLQLALERNPSKEEPDRIHLQ